MDALDGFEGLSTGLYVRKKINGTLLLDDKEYECEVYIHTSKSSLRK
jgi:hypothetical protein